MVANIGTIISETFAILLIPPKITKAVKTDKIIPIITGLMPKAFVKARVVVLACAALNTNPKHKVVKIAKIIPSQRLQSPLSM